MLLLEKVIFENLLGLTLIEGLLEMILFIFPSFSARLTRLLEGKCGRKHLIGRFEKRKVTDLKKRKELSKHREPLLGEAKRRASGRQGFC